MPDTEKITILLADEDALRRDGLAAVLEGTARFQILAQCPDGESAIEQIRTLRPDVAVVDLNLPRVHGIELVRRVRAEALGTRIVIMSGTTDDEIIREVVRAGGDGYILKNGPSRHLVDAIFYVRDGGQYFSPQLRRDGLDRHLLQEPVRGPVPAAPPRPAAPKARAPEYEEVDEPQGDDDDFDADEVEEERPQARTAPARAAARPAARPSARARRPVRRTADPQRFRERLREENTGDLEDRDYEILSLMADGIKPILDRLDDIEGRVMGMETGDEPVPSDVRGWLNTQMTDTFRGSGGRAEIALGRSVQDLEARLPLLIEEAVTSRFQQMAGKLHQEIEETHVRTLETFVKNIQVKLVQRVSALETDMSKQAEAMQQLRDYSQRTEDNLGRLISGVDRLAQELPKRLALPEPLAPVPTDAPRAARRRVANRGFSPKIFWAVIAALAIVIFLFVEVTRSNKAGKAPRGAALETSPAQTEPGKPIEIAANADVKTKLQAAQEYTDHKDYATAEDIYRQVLKSDPGNTEALKALASVLYREDKIEESAAILEKLPKN